MDDRLTELISTDGPLMITEPVIMEVLSGARTDEQENDLRRLLQGHACSASTPPPTSTPPPGSIDVAAAQESPLAG
ncbi:MAG TPA: hypothetical protein VIC82_06475 [Candidatus Nanopelagicales bacterium]